MTSPAQRDSADPEARTAAGRVRGRRVGGLEVFRGIPFAQPPTGRARFAEPRPAIAQSACGRTTSRRCHFR
jgi:carboxylesterase type B